MIIFERVCKAYARPFRGPAPAVLDQLSFTVAPGESFGLVGANGAGKTTTVKILLGLVQPTAGTVTIAGMTPRQAAQRWAVSYIPEWPAVYPFLSGRETLRFIARLHTTAPPPGESDIEAALATVGLAAAADQPAGTYSKGMRVRLGLAQALLRRPRLVVLDEPTTGLDPLVVRQVGLLITDLRARGVTLVISSHDLRTMHAACDRIALLHRGKKLDVQTTGAWGPDGLALEQAVIARIEAVS